MSGDLVQHRADGNEAAGVAVLSWQAVRSDWPSVLRGHVGLHIPKWRMRLHGCAAFFRSTSGDSWISPPSKPVLEHDVVKKDAAGKVTFIGMVEFDDRNTLAAFSRAAVAALDRYAPDWREADR
ncbi:hypothetical protein [Mesorhizobium sp.]|uniref:hypothetical protein n=1 Tax=Mesorhizobium sp. TaxID=1871066 RepID=UPI00120645A6|nr:hypothetical protein [Mesorhizobium sp.]TIL49092.1 MAG: hypothetical protein E5Y83_28235 [Mesorhizobium sp.]